MKKRISDEVFDRLTTMEELVELMNTRAKDDGTKQMQFGYNGPSAFIASYESFKSYIRKELPELSLGQILFIDKHFNAVKDSIYRIQNYEQYLTCMEFELRDSERKAIGPQPLYGLLDYIVDVTAIATQKGRVSGEDIKSHILHIKAMFNDGLTPEEAEERI